MSAMHPIAVAARLTGLSIDVLRAWERRYRVVAPHRDERGVRRYSERDIARLELARAATTLGHPIRSVAALSDEELRELVRAPNAAPASGGAAEPTVRAVIAAVERYDLDMAERALNAAALLMPTDEFVLDVLAPLMHQVGALWESGRLSVAQEHVISYLVRNLVAGLARVRPGPGPYAMLFATPPGEAHEFGIALGGCLAAMHGLRPLMLGPNVPAGDVVAAARHLRPRTIVIGTTIVTEGLPSFLRSLDAQLPARTDVWVGGAGAVATAEWPKRVHAVPTLDDFLRRVAHA